MSTPHLAIMATTEPPDSIHERIITAAPVNTTLLKILSETAHIPSALQESTTVISALTTQLSAARAEERTLSTARRKEQFQVERYRDSTTRRFAYSIFGKKSEFEEQVAKDDRRYISAVQAHVAATQRVIAKEGELATAKAARRPIDDEAKRRQGAQEALDRLYDGIFAGPTPEFPWEDTAELEVMILQRKVEAANGQLGKEREVARLLREAELEMAAAGRAMMEAEEETSGEGRGGSNFGSYFDAMTPLAEAERKTQQVEALVGRAKGVSTEVSWVGPVKIATRDGSTVFRSVGSELAFYEEVRKSMNLVVRASEKLREERDLSERRLRRVEAETKAADVALEAGRERLKKVRQGIFERMTEELPVYRA